MLLTVDLPDAHLYVVYDCVGHPIPYATSFNTETEEIELCIRAGASDDEKKDLGLLMQSVTQDGGQTTATPIIVKFKLPGAYAKKDNELIN